MIMVLERKRRLTVHHAMYIATFFTLMLYNLASGLVIPVRQLLQPSTQSFQQHSGFSSALLLRSQHDHDSEFDLTETELLETATSPQSILLPGITSKTVLPAFALTCFVLLSSLPAEAAAAGGQVASALWAYGHFVSVIAIFGCLSAEKTLVTVDMTEDDEALVVKLDLIYGVLAALL
jgi:hypothetical protein